MASVAAKLWYGHQATFLEIMVNKAGQYVAWSKICYRFLGNHWE